MTLGEFFAAAETGDETLIVRSEDRRRMDSTWTDAHIEAVTLPANAPRLWQSRSQEIAEILMVTSRLPS